MNEITIDIARANFEKWNQALTTGDAQTVAALYTKDATFLPTVSGEFKKGQEGASEYFVHFLEKDPIGTIAEDALQQIGEEAYIHSGIYNFELGPQDARTIVAARFTYVWQKEGDEWMIAHHHSSVRPQA
jgi:uncharacterized protein (TIGR02246 family)